MKRALFFSCCVLLSAKSVFAAEEAPSLRYAETAGISSAAVFQTALAQADVAIAKSVINDRLLKGEIGEAIRDQTVGRYIHRSGKWLDVSPRLGPQGLDHISVQLDENGVPRRLLIDETKFGSSRLLITKSNKIQMGQEYVSDRLSGLAKRYNAVLSQTEIPSAKVPTGLSPRRIIRIPLSDSESVTFWRPAEGAGPWRYDGPPELLLRARTQTQNLSKLYEAAADGRIDCPKRIFQVNIEGDVARIKILDAKEVDSVGGRLSKLPIKASLEFQIDRTAWASDVIRTKLSGELRRQMSYLSKEEATRLAQGIQNTAKTAEDILKKTSFSRFVTTQSAKAGMAGAVVALPLETLSQLLGNNPPDWSRVVEVSALAGLSASAGNAAGNAATYALLQTERGYATASTATQFLGLRSAGRFAKLAGGTASGGVTSVLFAYGGYLLGWHDIQTANRSTVAGFAGTGAGATASAMTLGLISTYGTAGTGVAISSLGGASATSASLAWLGGGSIASGGLGVTGGSIVLGTGVGVVIIGVTAAVTYGFTVYDEHKDNGRLQRTIDYLSTKDTFLTPASESIIRW